MSTGGQETEPREAVDGGAAKKTSTIAQRPSPQDDPLLATVHMSIRECAEDVPGGPGAACSTRPLISLIEQFVVDAGANETAAPAPEKSSETPAAPLPTAGAGADAIRRAAALLQCSSESCVLAHPTFLAFAETKGVPGKKIAAEVERVFKTAGPRATTELLNNFHIDQTLQRWARVFPDFFAYPFAMMDFDRNGDLFGAVDVAHVLEGKVEQQLGPGFPPVRRKARCAACVLNTDTSTGPGKHWVAVFVDTRTSDPGQSGKWSVEYFNSAGRPPPKPVVAWMERARASLLAMNPAATVEVIPVTTVAHQDSQTECGLYSLYYIRRRLEGTPVAFFQDPRRVITDEAMTKFRQMVFRAA